MFDLSHVVVEHTETAPLRQGPFLSHDQLMQIVTSSGDPAKLAANLLEAGRATAQVDDVNCALGSGHNDPENYCIQCSLPLAQMLSRMLTDAQGTVVLDQSTRNKAAQNVCTNKQPADRDGGMAKCCSGAGHESYGQDSGIPVCLAATFDAIKDEVTAADLVRDSTTKGWHYTGNSSTMIPDCCDNTHSSCQSNWETYNTQLHKKLDEINRNQDAIVENAAIVSRTTLELSVQTTKQAATAASLALICRLSNTSATDVGPWPTTVANSEQDCVLGQVRTVMQNQAARQAKLNLDVLGVTQTINVIESVRAQLDLNAAKTEIFTGHVENTAPPTGPDAYNDTTAAPLSIAPRVAGWYDHREMSNPPTPVPTSTTPLALLESARARLEHSPAASPELRAKLGLGLKLLESSTHHADSTAQRVIALMDQIIAKLVESKQKMSTFDNHMAATQEAHISSLVDQMAALQQDYDNNLQEQSRLGILQSNAQAITSSSDLSDAKDEWAAIWNAKEENSRRCGHAVTVDSHAHRWRHSS